MQVVAFRHGPSEGLGSLADSLERHEIACRAFDLYAEPADSIDLVDSHGLILMGGSMSANDDLPWLRVELDTVREAVDRGIPVLGVCLGAQLIARALGARVYRNTTQEIGWRQIRCTDVARADHLFGGLSDSATVFQWHAETFDLPPGAERLAYSDACQNEAFRVARNVYGVQFHPEVTPAIIAEWLRQDATRGHEREVNSPIDPEILACETANLARTLLDRWCGLVQFAR